MNKNDSGNEGNIRKRMRWKIKFKKKMVYQAG